MICGQGATSGYFCKRDLPEEMFRKIKGSGLSKYCLDCRKKQSQGGGERNKEYRRNYRITRTYGVDINVYNELHQKQDGKCLGCGLTAEETSRKTLNIDHCHTTGQIRGLLCWRCNTVLGHAMDNSDTLRNLANYLEVSRRP